MPETWIRSNRRALGLGFVLPGAALLAAVVCLSFGQWQASWLWRSLGIAFAIGGAILLAVLVKLIRQPRVSYQDGELLIYGGLADPIRVPVDVVECFFLGQAGGMIPDAAGREAEVRTVIVRLAESAPEWHHRDVKASLAHWCEGYITIRGTWCEPITSELMKDLNHRLAAIHRQRRQQAEARS